MLTLLPDLNVAPLKYAHVHREHGGPVHALSFGERTLPEGTFYEAFAYLEPACVGEAPGPHGTGFAATKPDALHGAITAAMAFWAWSFARRDSAMAAALRFDVDDTRFGFAAFPGLGVQGAHKRALFAAAERWNLCSWWEERLAHSELKAPGVTGLQIRSPIVGVSTVITWEARGAGANFGVGTAATPALALATARLQMIRSRDRLAAPASDLRDRRHHHFAGAEGLAAFRARAAQAAVRLPPSPPRPLLDSAVSGPWLQYAHVWRCLFAGADFHEKDRDDYFLF